MCSPTKLYVKESRAGTVRSSFQKKGATRFWNFALNVLGSYLSNYLIQFLVISGKRIIAQPLPMRRRKELYSYQTYRHALNLVWVIRTLLCLCIKKVHKTKKKVIAIIFSRLVYKCLGRSVGRTEEALISNLQYAAQKVTIPILITTNLLLTLRDCHASSLFCYNNIT